MGGSLDILAELTTRYGASLPDQEGLKKALLPELDESRAGVRKRAIQCLASLAASLAPASLDDLCATGEPAANGSQEAAGVQTRVACGTAARPVALLPAVLGGHGLLTVGALLQARHSCPSAHPTPPLAAACSVRPSGQQVTQGRHRPNIHSGRGGHQVPRQPGGCYVPPGNSCPALLAVV